VKRPQYFSAETVGTEDRSVENHSQLWRSVLDQALQDMQYGGEVKEFVNYRRAAKLWFRYKKKDFEEVCYLAELEPARVREDFYKVMGGYDEIWRKD
jgi:hypothetical protein